MWSQSPMRNQSPLWSHRVIILSEKEKAMLTHEGHLFWKHMNSKAATKQLGMHQKKNNWLPLPNPYTNRNWGSDQNDGSSQSWQIGNRNSSKNYQGGDQDTGQGTMHHPAQYSIKFLVECRKPFKLSLTKCQQKICAKNKKGDEQVPATPHGINFAVPDAYRNYKFGVEEQELFLLADSMDAER
uniref:Uncharacterized protein n=1 Tax=Ditylenchus dipsaci TaxID=166011 RepID=A0A915ENL6_9BILA